MVRLSVTLQKRMLVTNEAGVAVQKMFPPETKGEGKFYIMWNEDGKRKSLALAQTTKGAAEEARATHEARLQAVKAGIAHGLIAAPVATPDAPAGRLTVVAAAAKYLSDVQADKDSKTYTSYKNAVNRFVASCLKTYVDEIDRDDMLHLARVVRKEGISDRYVFNTFKRTLMFLNSVGREKKSIGLKKGDYPTFVEPPVETYDRETITALLTAATDDDKVWLRFFQFTGMRREEVENCDWSWVNFNKRVITVQENKKFGFKPKTDECRTITMSDALIALLEKWKTQKSATCGLVFPTEKSGKGEGCRPQRSFLRMLKVIAEKAKLNPEDVILHRFRATFATTMLQNGLDLVTVQHLLGHKDLKSTMRYLAPAQGAAVQAKVNGAFAAFGD